MELLKKIQETVVDKGEIALFYLAQAGFCIRTASGKTIVIDAYLSDACERLFNFKRMIPAVIGAHELNADLYLCTHHHADHFDPDTIPVVAKNETTFFVTAPDCETLLNELNITPQRYHILKEEQQWQGAEIQVRAIFADHGELAPDAVGFLIEVEGIKIYHVGDTAFRPEEIMRSLHTNVDIMIAPINGQYGNMNAFEACRLAAEIKPNILIPCHFWMFLEHVSEGGKGDPATFLQEASQLPETVKAMVMAPGEVFIYAKQ
ncbi:MBL fold metallo-hydrolase [Chitinophaga sp. MM2321]|uniref:MBL fold metallo-hydrolase n=1 Tax=Chitinophaga sp. MM2321 TaxID=3137178 RepID=UPI0032D576B6